MKYFLFLFCVLIASCSQKAYPEPFFVLGKDETPFVPLDIDSVQIVTPSVEHGHYPLDSLYSLRPHESEQIRTWVKNALIKQLPDAPYTDIPFLYERAHVNSILEYNPYYKHLHPKKEVGCSGLLLAGKRRYSVLIGISSGTGRISKLTGRIIVIDNWKSTFEFYKSEEFRRKPLKKANYELVVSKLLKEVIEGYPFDDE